MNFFKTILRIFFLTVVGAAFAPVAHAQAPGPECIQSGGGALCVPWESLGPMLYTGDGDDIYVDALLHDAQTNLTLYFNAVGDVQSKVDAGYNHNFGACRSWSQVTPWKLDSKKYPSDGASFVFESGYDLKELTYRSNCSDGKNIVHLTTFGLQKGYCPAGSVAKTSADSTNVYCVIEDRDSFNAAKNYGCSNLVGNPCNAATGNKFQREVDYSAPNYGGLTFARTYNSATGIWEHSYSARVVTRSQGPALFGMVATRKSDDGRELNFYEGPNKKFVADADVHSKLSPTYVNGAFASWTYTAEDGRTEVFDNTGRLVKVAFPDGHTTTITYSGNSTFIRDVFGRILEIRKNAAGQLLQVVDPGKGLYSYSYDTSGNLTQVVYPDLTKKTYHYNESINTQGYNLPHALTGITDENEVRFATFKYDSSRRVVVSEHPLGADRIAIKFNGDIANDRSTSSDVTDALGTTRTYSFSTVAGMARNAGISAPCNTCGDDARDKYYAANGDLLGRTEQNGQRTTYEYDLYGQETKRTEAVDMPEQREIHTTWHGTFHKPVRISTGALAKEFTYDPLTGNLLRRVIKDEIEGTSRTWAYKYNGFGQLTEIDGPRADVADIDLFAYDASGNLSSAKNALGQVTQFNSYDVEGRLLQSMDANGLVSTMTYDARGRLKTRKVGQEQTSFEYDRVGQLVSLTLPSTEVVTYLYDIAHRLTGIRNSAGERQQFTLDPLGNRTKVENFDAAGILTFTASAEFDSYNRLYKSIQSGGQETDFDIDEAGLVRGFIDPLKRPTSFLIEDHRLKEITSSDRASIKQEFDELGQVRSVTNDKGGEVVFTTNALGEVKAVETSDPEAYSVLREFDSAGNLKSRTDFRGIKTTYSYDALNRVNSIAAPGAVAMRFAYDAGANGKGRLTSTDDETGTTTRTYNSQGRLETVKRVFNGLTITLRYDYDSGGRLTKLTYPSGRVVTYTYDKARIVGIDVDTGPLLSGIAYTPFAGARSWRWGNGKDYLRNANLDGRISKYSLGNSERTVKYDDVGNIKEITDSVDTKSNQVFAYDDADRVTDYYSGATSALEEHYEYDSVGNRTSTTIAGANYNYAYLDGTDFLETVAGPVAKKWQYDATGSVMSDGVHTFKLDSYRSIGNVVVGAVRVDYLRNGMRQRLTKRSTDGTATHFVFDENGQLLAELDKTGAAIAEHIWLGNQPVGVVAGGTLNYVFADHLNTPRLITDTSNRPRWLWRSNPFGSTLPNESPAGLAKLSYGNRFPGQYYDGESGLHYNYHRDYDPQTGRYVQSDPIGLAGGINTYSYALGNPVRYSDPSGRYVPFVIAGICWGGGCEVGAALFGVGLAWGLDQSTAHNTNTWHWPIRNESTCPPGEAAKGVTNSGEKKGDRSGSGFPDRELPRDPNGNPVRDPEAEGAHTQLGQKEGRRGKYDQGREWGADGTPVKDIDFTDHGRPQNHTNPHEHPYLPNPTGGTPQHGPARPLQN